MGSRGKISRLHHIQGTSFNESGRLLMTRSQAAHLKKKCRLLDDIHEQCWSWFTGLRRASSTAGAAVLANVDCAALNLGVVQRIDSYRATDAGEGKVSMIFVRWPGGGSGGEVTGTECGAAAGYNISRKFTLRLPDLTTLGLGRAGKGHQAKALGATTRCQRHCGRNHLQGARMPGGQA